MKRKIYMIILINAEKAFDKIHQLFVIKNMQQTKNRRKVPQHNKGLYKKNEQPTSYPVMEV